MAPLSLPLATASTVLDLLDHHARERPHAVALRHRDQDQWAGITWGDYARQVADVAGGLVSADIQPGDRVVLLSGNRPEWHIADLGILAAGAVSVPAYPTSSSSQIAHLVSHSGARVAIVENAEQLAKLLLRRNELATLERIVMFEPNGGLDAGHIVSFADLCRAGSRLQETQPHVLEQRRAGIDPAGMATLVYTSGTTGPPKGAIITHDNIIATIGSVLSTVELGPEDRFLSFLPLSHIAERITSHFGQLAMGAETWFASSVATVPEDLKACRPTVFFAVPRVWEKLMDAVVGRIASQPRPVRVLLHRYLDLGRRRVTASRSVGLVDQLQYRALDRTLGRALRANLGLDRARLLVSAAAPIHRHRLEWFAGIGLAIAEVWGQTEDCGPATMNPPDAIRIGTVGKPLPGLELRLAEDGEVQVRGPSVCAGYYDNPAASRSLIDDDGWMSTGDLGSLDDAGYLTIIGRKKDLLILSSGKNISPQGIETSLEVEPLIAKAVVVGDGRPYLVALLSLDGEAVAEWAHHHHKIGSVENLTDDPDLARRIRKAVEATNARFSRAEGIKRWRLLPREFTVAGDELTPTLKVKRDVVAKKHAEMIDELYVEG